MVYAATLGIRIVFLNLIHSLLRGSLLEVFSSASGIAVGLLDSKKGYSVAIVSSLLSACMAFIVIFRALWSLMLKEWQGLSSKPKNYVLAGVGGFYPPSSSDTATALPQNHESSTSPLNTSIDSTSPFRQGGDWTSTVFAANIEANGSATTTQSHATL